MMEPIKNLFGKVEKPQPKKRRTERGDLLDYFLSHINPDREKAGYKRMNHARLSFFLKGIPTADLYFIKSGMEDRLKRNDRPTACKWFFWSLDAKKHESGDKKTQ